MQLKLNSDEKVIREAVLSFWLFQGSFALMAVSLFGSVYLFFAETGMKLQGVIMFAAITVFLVTALRFYIIFASTSIILTSRRLVFAKGFLHRQVEELYLTRIEGINIRQSLTARLMGYGTVEASGVGNEIAPIDGIDEPWVFHKAVSDAMHAAMGAEPAGDGQGSPNRLPRLKNKPAKNAA